ncbi:MAG: hypothetical protein AB7K24_05695 [Gemmataceae bacterium]
MRTIGYTFAATALLALPQLGSAQIKIQINGQNVQIQNAQAQPGKIAAFPTNVKGYLLQRKDIQEELKLTDDQVAKVTDELKKGRGAIGPVKDRDEYIKKMKEMAEAQDKAIAGILKPEQVKRLDQIDMQRQGLQSPKAIEALKITDDQQTKIREIQAESFKERRDIFKNGAQKGEELQKKIAEHMEKTAEKMSGVLTPEQKAKWKDLTGEPFKGLNQAVPFRGIQGGQGGVQVLPIQIKPVQKKVQPNIQ